MRKLVRLRFDMTKKFINNWYNNDSIVNRFGITPFYVVKSIEDEYKERKGRWEIEEMKDRSIWGEEIEKFFEVVKEESTVIWAKLNEYKMAFGRLSLHYQDFADKFNDKPVMLVEDTQFGGNKRWKTVSSQPGDRVFRIWDKDLTDYFDTYYQAPADPYDQYRTSLQKMEDKTVKVVTTTLCPNGAKAIPEQNLERFDIKVKSVFVSQEVRADNLESFIEELREKFK